MESVEQIYIENDSLTLISIMDLPHGYIIVGKIGIVDI